MTDFAHFANGYVDRQTFYSSVKIGVEFYSRRSGAALTKGQGTGFAVLGYAGSEATYVVANRHVLDPFFSRSGVDPAAALEP